VVREPTTHQFPEAFSDILSPEDKCMTGSLSRSIEEVAPPPDNPDSGPVMGKFHYAYDSEKNRSRKNEDSEKIKPAPDHIRYVSLSVTVLYKRKTVFMGCCAVQTLLYEGG
jgi:hypothetical protein